MLRGKFIVIEGIDGSGKGTQIKKLATYFKTENKPVRFLSYPDRKGPIGQLIDQYLYKKYNFSKEGQFLLYFSDFLKDKDKVNKWLNEGITVVSDRYFSSTMAYQCSLPMATSAGTLGGVPLNNALKVSQAFDLPRPDLIIFLNITPENSILRKKEQKSGKLDRHEESKKFLAELVDAYKHLAKRNALAKWVVINGERPANEVFEEIKNVLRI